MTSTLYITGDSFSAMAEDRFNNCWMNQLRQLLNVDLVNQSMPGVPQDWCWEALAIFSRNITPDDQIVVVLTDPARFWFVGHKPDLSNSWIIESAFNDILEPHVKTAIEYYVRYIQRIELDTQFLAHRLGWLNNITRVKGLKKPLIILAFEQFIPDIANYPDLIFSKGNLVSISKKEESHDDKFPWRGIDVRYNHMTLSNHAILANKIAQTLTSGQELDLTTGFITSNLTNTAVADPEFVNAELCKYSLEKYNTLPEKFEPKSLMRRLISK